MRGGEFLRAFKREAGKDRIGDVAAMMTYYALFALFPMIVFVVTMALLVLPQSVLDEGVQMASAAMPSDAGSILREQVQRMEQAAQGGFAIVGAALALWSASRGAASLQKALNDMFDKEETRPWWKRQLVALGTTLLVSVLLIVALGLLVAGPAVGHAIADRFGLGGAFDVAWSVARWLLAGVLVMIVWGLLYKLLPDTKAPFKIFTVGAVVGVVLWLVASQLFAIYVKNFGKYEATYGAMAGVIIFLMWLWISNLALLIGAEVNDVLADLRKERSPEARQLSDEGERRRPEPPTRPRREQPA